MADGVSINWSGITEFDGTLSAIIAKITTANVLAVTLAGNIVKRNAQTGLGLRSHRKGTWSPSPPGDAPALVSGALRRSVYVQIQSSGSTAMAQIGPTIIYGRIQELGGQTGRGHAVTLPPRPYIQPALEFSLPEISDTIKSAWIAAWEA